MPGTSICVPAAAEGDPWVLAGDPHSCSEIVLTARSAPIPLLPSGTIGVSLFSLARRSGAWRERGGPTVCAGPAGASAAGRARARRVSHGRGGLLGAERRKARPQGRRPGTVLGSACVRWAGGEGDSSAAFTRLPLARRQV